MKKITLLMLLVTLSILGYGNLFFTSPFLEECELEITLINENLLEPNQSIQLLNTSTYNSNVNYYKWRYITSEIGDIPDFYNPVYIDTIINPNDTLTLFYSYPGLYEVILESYDFSNQLICSNKLLLEVQDNICQATSPVCEYVCNGDFEGLEYQPTNISQYYTNVDGSGIQNIYYWDALCNSAWINHSGTTDIFTNNNNWNGNGVNGCPLFNPIGVPTNFAGTQSPYSGNNYVGIIAYSTIGPEYREYVLQRLNAPLVAGQTYFVSFAVSLASNSTLALDNMDLAFGHGPILNPCGNPSNSLNQFSLMNTNNHSGLNLANNPLSGLPAQIVPDIVNPYGMLNNPGNWVEISGYYTALGDEKQIAIGNFYIDSQTALQPMTGTSCLQGKAYYYIDKVSVQHISQPIDLTSSNHTICQGESVTLTCNSGFNSYSWSTGQSGSTLNSITVSPTITTTYTVTVFDPLCGSDISESITVIVNPLPNANAGSDITLCGYACDNFDGSGGVSYLWSPSLGLNDPTLEDPEICGVNVASNYTLTVTDANGCQNSDDVNVIVTPANFPPPTITGPNNLCCIDLTFSVPAGLSNYEWIVPQGLTYTSNLIGNEITLNPVGAGGSFSGQQICVLVTDPLGCVAQSCIDLTNCCGISEPISPTASDGCNPSLLSSLIANNGWSNSYSAATLHIQNDLIIDQNFTLNDCEVYVDVDRKITVKPGVTFNVIKTTIQNYCDFMWEGIVIENDQATLNMTIKSKITQAKNAVVSNSGGKFTILTSEFINNYRNLVINGYSSVHTGIIGQCKIEGTFGGMLSPHNTDLLPYSGVEIQKVKEVTIGVNTPILNSENDFKLLKYGILSDGSNVNIYNNTFTSFISFLPFSNNINATPSIAIWAKNGHGGSPTQFINIGDTGDGKNEFTNCHKAIQIEGSLSSNVIGNEFKNTVVTNIYCKNTNGKAINILNNTIGGKFGIGILCVDFLKSSVQVRNNLIDENNGYNHLASYKNTGIWLANVIPNPSLYNIDNNTIYRCENGIIADGVPSVLIKNNSIITQRNNNQLINLGRLHTGIRLYNSKKAEVALNTVTRSIPSPNNNGTLALTNLLHGIQVELSEESYVHDNNLHQMGYGMKWTGSSINSTISCNLMQRCYNGIFFDNAEIGHQGSPTNPSGNYWVLNQSSNEKMKGSLSTITLPTTNWYAVLSGLTNPNVSSANNLSILSASGNANCQIAPGGGFPGPIGPGKREAMFGSIVRDEKLFIANADENRMNNRKYLYNALKNDPSLMTLGAPDDIDYQNFFASVSIENEGKIEDVNILIADTNYLAAANINASIQANIVAEDNQKVLNEIYLSTWAQGLEIDSTQFYILEAIACQSPLEGGSAVYGARTMIGLDYECANGENRTMTIVDESLFEEEILDEFSIYPNPTSGRFTINNNSSELVNGKVQILDITGKIVAEYKLNNTNETQINITDLSDGIYHYLIYSNGTSVYANKLVISR